jgi:hypothetical protein
MFLMLRERCRSLVLPLLMGLPLLAAAQIPYSPQAGEYPIAGTLPGDQVMSDVSLNKSGGYVVWQDNATDGDGLGISAQRLDGSLSATLAPFRVNRDAAGDQEHPRVSLLSAGGAAVVWQSGSRGSQHIAARFLGTDGIFTTTGDLMANTYTNSQQVDPAVAGLADGNAVVTWSSYDQDGSLQGIYAQRFSPQGDKLGDEFRVNQFTNYNQRSSAVAALTNGDFVVAWVSEGQTYQTIDDRLSVDIFARLFGPDGQALGDEFRVNTTTNVCANPAIIGSGKGGFAVAWSQLNPADLTNSWDVFFKAFNADGGASGPEVRVNAYTAGGQYAPRLAAYGADYLAVWTSYGQDGSREGVYGRFLTANGIFSGDEFQVNTTTISQQFQPAIAADGTGRFLAVWSSFVGGLGSFDLFAQRYASALPIPQPAAPFVSALGQSRLSLTWSDLAGFDVNHYEVYVDNSLTPLVVTNDLSIAGGVATVVSNLVAGSSHSFQLAYVLADGRRSPLSDPATGTTWGEDVTGPHGVPDGLPDDWETNYFGSDPSQWPDPNADSDQDGASNLTEFLAGTNPIDAHSVLRSQLNNTPEGLLFAWNTQPGLIYQVQTSTDLATWQNVGLPRFATGAADSILVDGGTQSVYYRVIRLR